MVWGDYGRMDRKVFMGVCQILLDDLDVSQLVMGWYKLFKTTSIVVAQNFQQSFSSSTTDKDF